MIGIKDIPTLTGGAAERFIEKSDDNLRNRGSIDFSKEFDNSMRILGKGKRAN